MYIAIRSCLNGTYLSDAGPAAFILRTEKSLPLQVLQSFTDGVGVLLRFASSMLLCWGPNLGWASAHQAHSLDP